MMRNGQEFDLEESGLLDTIATYMDDEIRERIHCEMAPCSAESFLKRYLELDEDFEALLKCEFGIEV